MAYGSVSFSKAQQTFMTNMLRGNGGNGRTNKKYAATKTCVDRHDDAYVKSLYCMTGQFAVMIRKPFT